MKIIDTHTHFYGGDFKEDFPEAWQRAREAGVEFALLPNIDVSTIPELLEAVSYDPQRLRPMMGLHPCHVTEDYKRELATIMEAYRQAKEGFYLGIGEIGLDYYWDLTYKKEQREVFLEQLNWSAELKLAVSMHTREAVDDAVDIYKEFGSNTLQGSFHSFTGTERELKRIERETNAYVGVNGVFTFKNSDLKTFFPRSIPLERLLVETDAPYLAPVPKRGKRNEPANLPYILEAVAQAYGVGLKQVAQQIFENSCKLFNLAVA